MGDLSVHRGGGKESRQGARFAATRSNRRAQKTTKKCRFKIGWVMASFTSDPPAASASSECQEAEERARRVNELKDRYKIECCC
jgi:hypothetical protein